MTFPYDIAQEIAPSTPFILLAAMMLDWVIGDARPLFKIIPHPVVLIGKLIAFLDRRLNKPARGKKAVLIRGFIVTVTVTGVAASIGAGLENLLALYSKGWIAEVIFVAVLIAQRSLSSRCADVAKALSKDDLAAAKQGLMHLVGRDPSTLDKYGVARACVESLSENFSDAVLAPAFWFLLLGLPGLFAYKAINTLDSMIGYKVEKYIDFGTTAARLDDAVNWLPARISGFLIVLAAAFAPGADPAAASKNMFRDARKHESPNAGWPEAAMAGALGLALGGPRDYPGGRRVGVWIGDGRARLEVKDISKALYIFYVACFLLWLALAALVLTALSG